MAKKKISKKKFAIRVNQLGWHVNKIAMVLGIKKEEDAVLSLSTDADLERLAYLLDCPVEFLTDEAAPMSTDVPKVPEYAFGKETIRPEIYNTIDKYNIPVDDDRLMVKDLGMPGKIYLEILKGEMRANTETIGFVERAFEAALMTHPEMNGALKSDIREWGNSDDFRKAAEAEYFRAACCTPSHSSFFNTPLPPMGGYNGMFGMDAFNPIKPGFASMPYVDPRPIQTPVLEKAEEDETYDANDDDTVRTDKEVIKDIANLLKELTDIESFAKVKKLADYIGGLKEMGIE